MPENAGKRLKRADAMAPRPGEDPVLTNTAVLLEREGRLPSKGLDDGLRVHTARGTVINAAFQIGLAGVNLLRRVVVAAFLTAAEFGLWGAMLASLFVVIFIKDAGFNDKFIQQAEKDQEAAFHKFFTLELMMAGVVIALAGVGIPLFAALYGQPEIIVPGLVLSLAVLGSSLQAPNVIYYRNMNFVRQRILQSIEPLTAFTITIGLAIAGFGYWSLVIGAVAGSFLGAAGALLMCPYKIRLRFERETLAEYFSFSWPLVLSRGELIMVAQASLLIATWTSGLAAAGAITLATAVTQFAHGVDNIVTRTVYPAICAVRQKSELFFEVFVKSNRLALMWGMPFGFGLALFAPDLVHFVIGDKWEEAIVVIQAFGLAAGIDQLGFNWSAFLRALNITKPLAMLSLFDFFAFLAVTTPLLVLFGLPGFAAGVLVAEAVRITARTYYLKRLFPQLKMLRYVVRAVTPVLPAVAIVLGARLIETGSRTPELAMAELVVYVLAIVGATALFERRLIREVLGYLRRKASKPTAAGLSPAAR